MKKKIVSLCICAALLAVTVIGGTLAYFTDTDTATNTFTIGDVDIILYEQKVIYNDDNDKFEIDPSADVVTENVYKNIYPGAELPKDPTVKNVGGYDAYVKVDITVPNAVLTAFHAAADNAGRFDAFKTIVTGGIMSQNYEASRGTDNGIADGLANEDYLLAYTTGADSTVFTVYALNPLKAEDSAAETPAETLTVFETITVPGDCTSQDLASLNGQFTINISATAIQAKGFEDAKAAFTAMAAETPSKYGESYNH